MATVEELIASNSYEEGNRLHVSEDLRTITVPDGEGVLGVYSDDSVRRVWFDMPRYCDGTDLWGFDIRVNYLNALGEADAYIVDDAVHDDETITFSWLVGRHAFAAQGAVTFNVCLRLHGADPSTVLKEFNTTLASMTVLEGLETDEAVSEEYTDVFNQLVSGWSSQVSAAVSSANSAAASANGVAASVQASYQQAEAARQAAYEQAEASRSVDYVGGPFTVADGMLQITFDQEG